MPFRLYVVFGSSTHRSQWKTMAVLPCCQSGIWFFQFIHDVNMKLNNGILVERLLRRGIMGWGHQWRKVASQTPWWSSAAVFQAAPCHQSCLGLFHVGQIACPDRPEELLLLLAGGFGGGCNLCQATWRFGLNWSRILRQTHNELCWTQWTPLSFTQPPTNENIPEDLYLKGVWANAECQSWVTI